MNSHFSSQCPVRASDLADGSVLAHSRVSVPFTPIFCFNLTHPSVRIYCNIFPQRIKCNSCI
jgi:hypothetical protein